MNEGFIYKLIFRKALGDANEVYHKEAGYFSSKKLLQTMWDRMGIGVHYIKLNYRTFFNF